MNDNPKHSDKTKNEDDFEDVPVVILPNNFLKCSRSDLIVLISRIIVFLIQINDNNAKVEEQQNGSMNRKLTRFHSSTPPNISIYNYLIRLTKYSALESSVLISSVYYIDLLSSIYPAFTLNSLTAHRFLLTATSVASKGLCDSFCTNSHYAKVGGVQCSELNILEEEFLRKVNYRVIPRDDNIAWCKFENQQNQFTIYENNILPQGLHHTSMQKNGGFNVLNMYYGKMIQLVGTYSTSSDKSRKVNYKLDTHLSNSEETNKENKINTMPEEVNRHTNKRTFDASNGYHIKAQGEVTPMSDNLEVIRNKKHATEDIKIKNKE